MIAPTKLAGMPNGMQKYATPRAKITADGLRLLLTLHQKRYEFNQSQISPVITTSIQPKSEFTVQSTLTDFHSILYKNLRKIS